ncbi:MAG: flagellar basal body rod C-terminal domain-containing protein [Caldilineaceae bacterium]
MKRRFNPNGAVFVDNQQVAQIGLADVDDPAQWVQKEFISSAPMPPPRSINTVSIKQGYLELSNVDENVQIVEMMRILRLCEANQRSLRSMIAP